ncbi:uncharacterized protein MYCGRDRAFT_111558 [Zymoseptoria tritici IPO323]|uniref:Uncharacterized protein n=1 Tax=Zymoseptoria tritici (strain CBS 115943 / IPO323) TaxID=336722 RepID=F9XP81_ZYMTI|nr:uncharacterized protein MYCGRDRAFT_111558 [Zymoseptoria tritici IPO323]EGP83040.1 hypothetical protein MYCGRDRAFT_111558 [Zymoseptoria tritici IPO323]
MWISMKEFRAWEWSSVDDGSHYDPKKADQSLMDDSVAHVSGMAQAQGRMVTLASRVAIALVRSRRWSPFASVMVCCTRIFFRRSQSWDQFDRILALNAETPRREVISERLEPGFSQSTRKIIVVFAHASHYL